MSYDVAVGVTFSILWPPVVAGVLFLVLTLIGLVIVIASLISWYVSS